MMRPHAPNFFRRFDRGPADMQWKLHAKRQMVDRYRELQRLEQRDPEQFNREIEQIELEDDIVGLARGVRMAKPEDAEQRKAELSERVAKVFDLRIQNREARIKRLAKSLEEERAKLETEKKDREAAVKRRTDQIVRGGRTPGGPEDDRDRERERRGGERPAPPSGRPPQSAPVNAAPTPK
jgi:hypothetical protein